MDSNKKLVMETYRNLTAIIVSDYRKCEEAVEGLHQALAYELAQAYMVEHGYGIDINGNFIEKQETLVD